MLIHIYVSWYPRNIFTFTSYILEYQLKKLKSDIKDNLEL